MKKYDYLIVGSGLYGSTFAYLANKQGKSCLVIDKRSHFGGNLYCSSVEGIIVHKYGAHIFHTSNKRVWNFVNSIVEFNRYTNSPIANYKGALFNLPFNMNTFYQLWGVTTPEQAEKKIREQRESAGNSQPKNLEEQAISLVGTDIYEKLIKGYTEKQWGRKPVDLPAFIIKRLPVRFTFDNNYFNDTYQGIPIGGYNGLIDGLLEGIEVRLGVDYFSEKEAFDSMAERIVFTGQIDEYYDFRFGKLQYRSLRFEDEVLDMENYQGNAVVNYTDSETPYTRIIEHKHFEFGRQSKTVITREYPQEGKVGCDPYYPINDERNNELYAMYEALARTETSISFGGRLAEYKYYDMDKVIERAILQAETFGIGYDECGH